MIDLDKNQIVDPVIKCWVKDHSDNEWIKRELASIDHRDLSPYSTRYPQMKKYPKIPQSRYEECTLEDPYKPKMRYMTRDEVIRFIARSKEPMLVSCTDEKLMLPSVYSYTTNIQSYKYMILNPDGSDGETKEFMIEDKDED